MQAVARQTIEARQQDVVSHRLVEDEAKPPLARHHADAGVDRGGRTGNAAALASHVQLDARAADAEQPPQHPVRAAAQQSGEAHDLAGAHADGIRARLGILQQHRPGCGSFDRDAGFRASGHGLHQVGGAERAALAGRRHAAVAQHGAAVGERHDLVEPVRHVDDRRSLSLHAFEHGEQLFDLARLERRGRLVENEEAAALAQCLGDGDELALGEREPVDAPVHVRREIELRKLLARLGVEPRPVDQRHPEHAPQRRLGEPDVVGDRQGRDQPQLLRNGRDAGCDRVVRVGEAAGAAVDCDLAPVGPVHAAEEAYQRRLAGAVLADERVDLTRHDIEIDAVERKRGTEALGDLGCTCGRHGVLPLPACGERVGVRGSIRSACHIDGPPHPARCARRPLPASGER